MVCYIFYIILNVPSVYVPSYLCDNRNRRKHLSLSECSPNYREFNLSKRNPLKKYFLQHSTLMCIYKCESSPIQFILFKRKKPS